MEGLPIQPACPAPLAVAAWNFMGGFEWGGVELAAEMFGVQDVELWLHELAAIRNHDNRGNA